MKKIYFIFLGMAALLVAGAAIVSCSEKNLVVEEIPEYTYSVSVNATKGGDTETRALTLDGTTLNASWLTSENVYVKKGLEWASEGTLKPQENGTSAYLKGALTFGSPIAPDNELFLQFPNRGEPDYTGQKGTIADIAANFDYATATVTVDEVNGETGILTTTAANFVNQQAIVEFVLTNRSTDAAQNVETLTITAGGNEITVGPDSATSDLYVAIPGFSGGTFTLEATNGSNDFYYTNASFPYTITNNHFYRLPVKLHPVAINVSTPESKKFSLDKKQHNGNTISYSIDAMDASPVVTATPSVDWITVSSTSSTTVTFNVPSGSNTTRTGVITLSYPGASNVDITIVQSKNGNE